MNDIWKYLSGFGSGTFITIVIAYILFKNPDIVKKWGAIFYDLLSRIFDQYKYKSEKYRIETKLNGFVDDLSKDSDIDPAKVKIQWAAREEDERCIVNDNDVIIVMRDREHKNKNFVHAAYFFTSNMLLWRTKRHISKKQGQAIDIYTAKKIIEKDPVSLRIYLENYFQPLLEDADVNELVKKFVEIDKSGFYTNILLTELSSLGYKTLLDAKDSDIVIEAKLLIEFLYNFANRELGDEQTEDTFIGKYSRCSIKIVSTITLRILDRIESPAKRILDAFSRGLENVYIIGPYGECGKVFIDKVIDKVISSNEDLIVCQKRKFTGCIKKDGEKISILTYFAHVQNPKQVCYLITDDMTERIEKFKTEVVEK